VANDVRIQKCIWISIEIISGYLVIFEWIIMIRYNQTCLMWPSKGTVKYGFIWQVVA